MTHEGGCATHNKSKNERLSNTLHRKCSLLVELVVDRQYVREQERKEKEKKRNSEEVR